MIFFRFQNHFVIFALSSIVLSDEAFMTIGKFIIHLTSFTAFSFVIIFGIAGCEKDDTDEFVSQAKVVAEYVRAEDYMADLFGLMHHSIFDTTLNKYDTAHVEQIFVTRQYDTLSGIATYLIDFDSPYQPTEVQQVYNGKVTAHLYQPFENEGAVMEAVFNDYTVNGYLLQGNLKYKNTGEFVNGAKKYSLDYNLDLILNEKKLLSFQPERDLFWSTGFDTPDDVDDDEFTLPEGAAATYFSPDADQQTIPVNTTFTESWTIGISCFRYFQNGKFVSSIEMNGKQLELNGAFIDADLDNCADKVMIKNFDGSLGYPYYL